MKNIEDTFNKFRLREGRMISAHKLSPKGSLCIWNANVLIKSKGKIWYGDLNLTKEGNLLKEVAKELGETVYVLREMDCRFNTEKLPFKVLISKAVWSTDKEIPYEN